jgi:HK97 family phage portal protein
LGIFARIFGGKTKAAEGSVRPGPYALAEGWLPAGTPWNFWQMGKNVRPYSAGSAMVEACVSAYSQTVAMCPGDHWRKLPNGGRARVDNSPLARIIRRPNDYQSISDFLLNATRELYMTGEFFALAIRDERGDIAELHLMRSRACFARVAMNGEIFYSLGGNAIVDQRFMDLAGVPARDVLHVRLHTPVDPLRGESPLMAAALDVAATDAALQQQVMFLRNEAKPSIMLSTDSILKIEQVKELRAAWDAQTRGDGAGGTPILTAGLKPVVVSAKAVDAQVAELMKMSAQNIALAFRIPLQMLGLGGTAYASTELLMQDWIAKGLGFALNHIEEAVGHLFGLSGYPAEYVEFNTASLQRSAFRERIEALARSTISGIHSPDEARNELDLPTVPGGYGQEPRVQQQVVPLSYYDKLLEQGSAPAPSPPEQETDDDAQRDPGQILERIHAHSILH